MTEEWKKILDKNEVPEINQDRKKQTIEELKIEILNTEVSVKENYWLKLKKYIPFINKTTLLAQFIVLVFGLFVIATTAFERTRLILSWVMPMLAFLQLLELSKSFKYNMYEIEMSCKINLKELISIKLILYTVINLCIMTIFACMTGIQFQYNSYLLIIYFLVPFMLTNVVNIGLIKLTKNKSNEIGNLSVLILINTVLFILNVKFSYIYEVSSILGWIVILIFTTSCLINLMYQFYEKEEDYIWNL